MGRGSHGKIASIAIAIEVYREEHKKLKHKLCFLGETEGEVVPVSHVLRACAAKANTAAAFSHNFRYFVKYSSQNCLSLLLLQQVYYETNNKQQKKCGKKRGREVGFYPMRTFHKN